MKHYLFSILLLAACGVKGQTITVKQALITNQYQFYISYPNKNIDSLNWYWPKTKDTVLNHYNFYIEGGAYQKKDSALVVTDSAATIKQLIILMHEYYQESIKNRR